jgi:hypothetical protein
MFEKRGEEIFEIAYKINILSNAITRRWRRIVRKHQTKWTVNRVPNATGIKR